MKLKKIKKGMFLFGLILASTMAFAAWQYMTASTSYTGHVTSEGTLLTFASDFSDCGMLDTTNGSDECQTTAIIGNANGLRNATVNISMDKIDVDDGCVDYEDDCSVTFDYLDGNDWVEVTDGDQIIVESGETLINSTLTCVRSTCPQNVTVNIDIIDQGAI